MAERFADRGADVEMEDDPSIQRKGRGFDPRSQAVGSTSDGVKHRGKFDVLDSSEAVNGSALDENAARSVEGYIVIVTGIDEEATEEEVVEKFADFGHVENCHLNLDRRTGYVKGYALLEFRQLDEARRAIEACQEHELTLMDKHLKADFAFVQPPAQPLHPAAASSSAARRDRDRSRSPTRR